VEKISRFISRAENDILRLLAVVVALGGLEDDAELHKLWGGHMSCIP
jgi:hypothetical protein